MVNPFLVSIVFVSVLDQQCVNPIPHFMVCVGSVFSIHFKPVRYWKRNVNYYFAI